MLLDYKMIGERIQKQRKKIGMTQEELSEKLGITSGSISRMERGDLKPNLLRISQISSILGTTSSAILTGTSPANTSANLDSEFYELLSKCSATDQKLIYELAKTVLKVKEDLTNKSTYTDDYL